MTNISTISNTFKNTEIRAFEDEGISWFVAKDISDALGYRDASAMVRMLDKDEKGTRLVCTPSGEQEANVINESGMYHALIKSRKPEAKPFRKWVTSEVLPSIRKTGTYTMPQTLSPAQQRDIQEAVAQLSKEDGAYAKHYGNLKTHFRVGSYKDIPADKFPAAMAYLLGEWVPETEALAIPDDMMLVHKGNFKALQNRLQLMNERYSKIIEVENNMFMAEQAATKAYISMMDFRESTLDPVREAKMLANTMVN